MCGLIGYSSGSGESFDLEKIKLLFLYNSLERGKDSSGLYSPRNGLKKSLDEGSKFISGLKEEIVPDTVLIGHVRSATSGNVTVNNAHPFRRGNCILAHNGTIKNGYALLKKRDINWAGYTVDSDIITGCIAHDKNADVLGEIDGGAAVLFHDVENPEILYVFRNKDRSLYRGNIGPDIYISSIKESLEYIDCINIKEFKEDHLYTIKNGQLVDNTRKIVNVPYKATIDQPLNKYNYSVRVIALKAIDCNVRAKWDFTTKNGLTVKEGKYYEIRRLIDKDSVEIYCNYTKKLSKIDIIHLEMDDVIYSKDLIKCTTDIFYTNCKKGDPPIFKKGTVLVCTGSHTDGELTVSKPDNSKVHIPKSLFVKLTPEEVEEHNKIKIAEAVQLSIHNRLSSYPCINNRGVNTLLVNAEDEQDGLQSRFNKFIENLSQEVETEVEVPFAGPTQHPEISMSIEQLEPELLSYFMGLDATLANLMTVLTKYAETYDDSYVSHAHELAVKMRDYNQEIFDKVLICPKK